MKIAWKYLLLIGVLTLSTLWINQLFLSSTVIGITIGGGSLLYFALLLGKRLMPDLPGQLQMILGLFLLHILLILVGAPIYLLISLAKPIPLLIFTCVSLTILWFTRSIHIVPNNRIPVSLQQIALLIGYIGMYTLLFIHLVSRVTLEATRSPWDVIGGKYLFAYFILSCLLVLSITRIKSLSITLTAAMFHSFLATSVGILLFPVGFGYDPLLHSAALKEIVLHGAILPKTILYSGNYAFIVILQSLTQLPINHISSFFLPIAFAITLPAIALVSMQKYTHTSFANVSLSLILLLLIPLPFFTTTTPQAHAFILLIASAFFWLYHYEKSDNTSLGILICIAFAALFIHPLTGLLLVTWLMLALLRNRLLFFKGVWIKQLVWFVSVIAGALLIPAVFLVQQTVSHTPAAILRLPALQEFSLTNLWYIEAEKFTPQYDIFFDVIYLYRYTWVLIFLAVCIAAIYLFTKKYTGGFRQLFVGFAIAWLSSSIVRLFFTFSQLITYEQRDYPQRLFISALYFLLPLFVTGIIFFWNKVSNKAYDSLLMMLLIAAVMTSSMFLSYPRYDSYESVRNYTTSIHDITAVRTIQIDASDKPYVVLANQSVAAAAISELGFYKYYNDHFFYPVPTGGELYSLYLSMVYDAPLRETAKKAAELTGVPTVYFVLNDYWFNAETIREKAALESDATYSIDSKIIIFRYNFYN